MDVDNPAPAASSEAARLQALHALHVLDTAPEQVFDDLVSLASHICDVPIALVTLVDQDRQWFKARHGLAVQETPREFAFCHHAIQQADVFEVDDAIQDIRFASNPLVTADPHIRFYAGAPMLGSEGFRYGTLCVIDTKPRTLSQAQRDGLVRLARLTSTQLESRRLRLKAEQGESTLQRLLEAMPDAVVTCDGNGLLQEFNRAARAWHGIDPRSLPAEQWADHFGLYAPPGDALLPTDRIPLLRAWRGERVREAEIVIRAAGCEPRTVLCNADRLEASDGTLLGAVCVMHDVTQLKITQAAAALESKRFLDAFSAAAQGMALVSLEGAWMEVNDALCEILGYDRATLLKVDFQTLTHPDDLDEDLKLVAELLAGVRTSYQMQKRYFHQDGSIVHVNLSVSLVRDSSGKPLHFVSQIQDFTRRYEIERQLRNSEAELRMIADNVPALIAHVGPDMRYRFVNQAHAYWNNVAPETLAGMHMRDALGPELFAAVQGHVERALAGHAGSVEVDARNAQGEVRHLKANYVPDDSGSDDAGFYIMAHDITPQVRLARVLQEQALRDELTGLPNRAAWNEELGRAVARANRTRLPLTMLFLDLDGFKGINDTHGHAAGDAVLRGFATLLRKQVRVSDFVARLGGDEFVVLLDGITDVSKDPLRIAGKIIAAAGEVSVIEGKALRMVPSIGISIQRGPAFDADALQRCADDAMYAAKRRGSGQVELDFCGTDEGTVKRVQ
ncbi:MAG: PAS domain S-box protein [Pseudomonadota bacterium]